MPISLGCRHNEQILSHLSAHGLLFTEFRPGQPSCPPGLVIGCRKSYAVGSNPSTSQAAQGRPAGPSVARRMAP